MGIIKKKSPPSSATSCYFTKKWSKNLIFRFHTSKPDTQVFFIIKYFSILAPHGTPLLSFHASISIKMLTPQMRRAHLNKLVWYCFGSRITNLPSEILLLPNFYLLIYAYSSGSPNRSPSPFTALECLPTSFAGQLLDPVQLWLQTYRHAQCLKYLRGCRYFH